MSGFYEGRQTCFQQKLLRDRVEHSFAEFIARVPAGSLGDAGLKRHYKLPETLKVLHAPGVKK